jgi:hypothetical protein
MCCLEEGGFGFGARGGLLFSVWAFEVGVWRGGSGVNELGEMDGLRYVKANYAPVNHFSLWCRRLDK